MNKKANEQFKSNEKRMMEIFMTLLEEKDIQKITVREICEAAQINRSTFYNHFLDVYDMLDKMMESHVEIHRQIFLNGASESARENLYLIFSYMKNHKVLYRASFHSPTINKKMVEGFERIYRYHEFNDYENLKEEEKQIIGYKIHFITQGMLSVISRWLDHNCDLEVNALLEVISEFYDLD